MRNNLRIIGVTGITGSGTSTVADILKEQGGLVISADKLAHDAIKKDREAHKKVVGAFGVSILMPDGEINRKALGSLVFGDGNNEKRALLESIIHPVVLAKIGELVRNCQNPFVVIDAPLLIESGLAGECDEVWLVTAADETRVARIMERDGVDRLAAEKRLKSRQNEGNLIKQADVVISNNGDFACLREQVNIYIDKLLQSVKIYVQNCGE